MTVPVYTSAAQSDLNLILAFISRDKPVAARNWVKKIEEKCRLIAVNPAIGQTRPEFGIAVRSSLCGRYVIFYRSKASAVEILRVLPGDLDITFL